MYINRISKLALESMLREVDIIDKPGLVTPLSSGSHKDMDYALMLRGIRSLRGYFREAFRLGFFQEKFNNLRELGKRYERSMLRATGNVNTHKGAIFQLGILVYLTGRIKARGVLLKRENLESEIQQEIEKTGLKSLLRESRYGARKEVASAYKLSLESLNYRLSDRLYFIMSKSYDTNIIRRGGKELLKEVRQLSARAITDRAKRETLKNLMEAHMLSPGGSADILINSIFIEDFLNYEKFYSDQLAYKILEVKESVAQDGYKNKVILSLIFPGWIKEDKKFKAYFEKYRQVLDRYFGQARKTYEDITGYRAVYDLGLVDEVAFKLRAVDLEEASLIDIDVYGDFAIDRKYMELDQRKCLVCQDRAKKCMIEGRHSREEVILKALEIVNEDKF